MKWLVSSIEVLNIEIFLCRIKAYWEDLAIVYGFDIRIKTVVFEHAKIVQDFGTVQVVKIMQPKFITKLFLNYHI